jgi:hypothetical protein
MTDSTGTIHVLATTFDSTRSALAVALTLAENAGAHPTIFVAQLIPNDGELRARSRWTAFFANHYQNVVHEVDGEAHIDVCLCQSLVDVRARIPADATVVISGPAAAWLETVEEQLAGELSRMGRRVVFVASMPVDRAPMPTILSAANTKS